MGNILGLEFDICMQLFPLNTESIYRSGEVNIVFGDNVFLPFGNEVKNAVRRATQLKMPKKGRIKKMSVSIRGANSLDVSLAIIVEKNAIIQPTTITIPALSAVDQETIIETEFLEDDSVNLSLVVAGTVGAINLTIILLVEWGAKDG